MRNTSLKRLAIISVVTVAIGLLAYGNRGYLCAAVARVTGGKKSVAERLAQYGPAARQRWQPHFTKAGVPFPPRELCLLGLKDEGVLEVYGKKDGNWVFVRRYPIIAASGDLGPKLREGDEQVPEGIYGIESLNPNSRFHLSLRVNYPNAFDRQQAAKDGRSSLGGDIMIHGNAVSIGCLAMGDEAAEDLFVLAADTGLNKISVILAPLDFRRGKKLPASIKLPEWAPILYRDIQAQLKLLPLPPAP